MSLLDGVVVRPSGETAVVLELGAGIDPAVHDRVLGLADAVAELGLPGVEEVVPSYRSVLLRVDPLVTSPGAVLADIERAPAAAAHARAGAAHVVDVTLDGEDLAEVATRCGVPARRVVELLGDATLRVYLHGFAPGFAYLGGLPPALHLPRRATPRPPVRPGAVLLAAGQLALCPVAMPTGWWVVGHTDLVLFDPERDPPVPFRPGDAVRLRPVLP